MISAADRLLGDFRKGFFGFGSLECVPSSFKQQLKLKNELQTNDNISELENFRKNIRKLNQIKIITEDDQNDEKVNKEVDKDSSTAKMVKEN